LRLWDPLAVRQLVSIPASFDFWHFSADGRQLAFKGPKSKMGIWEVSTAPECRELQHLSEHPTRSAKHFVFHPHGRVLLSADHRSGIRVWDLKTTKQLLFLPEPACINVFLPADGKHIISSSEVDGLKRWPLMLDLEDTKMPIRSEE